MMLKDKGVKNLLRRLRDNVENSHNPPEIIKSSRLISSAKGNSRSKSNIQENIESPLKNKKASKILINPVPVDIAQKSKTTKK